MVLPVVRRDPHDRARVAPRLRASGGVLADLDPLLRGLRRRVRREQRSCVSPASEVTVGIRTLITAREFGVSIREPVDVVEVVQTSDRVGFAYRTLAGHPVSGEEAFIVHRDREHVVLTIRSLTRAADHSRWRFAFPFLLLAQKVARRRYMRALRGTVAGEREASSSRS